jgi:DNA-binding MarR family transcriptional regulator
MKKASPSTARFYTSENYRPEGSVAYLMLRNKSIYQRLGDMRLAELGITAAQMSVLMMISYGNKATISTISQALGVDPAATVRIVQKLEKMNLVSKVPSKNDGRVIQLLLTSAGKKKSKMIPLIWCELLNDSLAGFTATEFEQFKSFLMRVEKNNLLQLEGAV